MPAAVAIPLITAAVSAGTTIAATAMNNRGASNAARTQADAVDQAAKIQQESQEKALAAEREQINFERQQAEAQQRSRAPYVQTANDSLAALAQRLKLPAFNPQAMPPSIPPQGQGQTMPAGNLGGYQTRQQPMYGDRSIAPVGQGQSLADMAKQPGMQPSPTLQDDGSGMVTLIAPTGEQKSVPRSQAARYIARGARYAQ